MQTLIEHFQMIMPCPLTLMHEGVKKSGGVIIWDIYLWMISSPSLIRVYISIFKTFEV